MIMFNLFSVVTYFNRCVSLNVGLLSFTLDVVHCASNPWSDEWEMCIYLREKRIDFTTREYHSFSVSENIPI